MAFPWDFLTLLVVMKIVLKKIKKITFNRRHNLFDWIHLVSFAYQRNKKKFYTLRIDTQNRFGFEYIKGKNFKMDC